MSYRALCGHGALPPVVTCASCKCVAALCHFCIAACCCFIRCLRQVAPGIKDVFDTLIAGRSRKEEGFPAGGFQSAGRIIVDQFQKPHTAAVGLLFYMLGGKDRVNYLTCAGTNPLRPFAETVTVPFLVLVITADLLKMYLRQVTHTYIIRKGDAVSMIPEYGFPLKRKRGFLRIGTPVSNLRNWGVKPPGILTMAPFLSTNRKRASLHHLIG